MKKTTFFHSCVGVFQGGGCRAAALVGGYNEAISRGVQFAEVAGTSAGAIVAALVGAGASPDQLRRFIDDLDFRRFLVPPDLTKKRGVFERLVAWRFGTLASLVFHQGFHSSFEIESWVEECLRTLLGPRQGPTPFSALMLPTSIVATDIISRKARVWNQRMSPNDSVAKAVRASCSIPIFFQPVDRQYVDGGVLSNLPTFVYFGGASGRQIASRVLAFVLRANDEAIGSWDTKAFLSAVANTVVDGSQELQLSLQSDVHVIEIPTLTVKATDFDKIDRDVVSKLINSGHRAASAFFDAELKHVKAPSLPANMCLDREDLFASFTQHLDDNVEDILISEFDTDFVYSLFPSLLIWRSRGVQVRALLPKVEANMAHGIYRRRLLSELGVQIVEAEAVPFRGYFVNCQTVGRGTAYIGVSSEIYSKKIEAVVYDASIHSAALASLYQSSAQYFTGTFAATPVPRISADSQSALITRLQTVAQYGKSGIKFSFESIRLSDMVSLTNYVREFKYRQTGHLINLYEPQHLQLFQTATITFGSGKTSIVTPPVVEEAGDQFVIIEGSVRATFLRDHGVERMACVVIRGVSDALPGNAIVDLANVRVAGRSLDPDFRYDGLNYAQFRHIERQVHPLDSLL